MINDHPGGGAQTPPVDGDHIAGPSDVDAAEQPVESDAGRLAAPDDWLAVVARTAAADADAPIELLGEYLNILADAALSGRRPKKRELAAVRRLGRRAAEQGVDANQAVDLYLSAAWRLWQEIPMIVRSRDRDKVRAAAEAVLRVISDAVEVLVEGHQAARRQMIRQEDIRPCQRHSGHSQPAPISRSQPVVSALCVQSVLLHRPRPAARRLSACAHRCRR